MQKITKNMQIHELINRRNSFPSSQFVQSRFIIAYCHLICNSFLKKILKMSLDKLQTLCYNCHAMSNKPVVALDKNNITSDKRKEKKCTLQ